MKKQFKKWFALTDKGAADLQKACITSFFVYMLNMLPAMILMLLFDELLSGKTRESYVYIIASVVILILMYLILRIDYDTLYTATYQESANLRINIADTLSKLPLSYFSKNDLTDLSQTIMSDVERIEHGMSRAMPKTIGFFMFLPVILILLFIGNWIMGIVIATPIIMSFLFIILSKKIQVKGATKYFDKLRANSESFQETIELQQEIKSFGLADITQNKLYQKMEESEKIHIKSELTHVTPILLANWSTQLILGIVILVGVVMLQAGNFSLLYFMGYILFAIKIKELIDSVSEAMTELFYLDARIQRIKAITETKRQEGTDMTIKNYTIELENVGFSYNDDYQVLKDISFTANQNEVTALVGMSGCGKTSILKLISRLYDYDYGQIKIDGVDIKEISTNSLFAKISIVFQDVALFNASIIDNIRIGKKDATDEEIYFAAKMANCTEFIEKLPNGYNTFIGENGATLSGGERQRLSIARAFLKNAPIIILDEIAASLDIDNEKVIHESLNKLIENKTVIIISHRMKSIENADKIVVIDAGKVEAVGKHRELKGTSAIYQKLLEQSHLAEEFTYGG